MTADDRRAKVLVVGDSGDLALPNTGTAILIDTGETGDIHPREKHEAGDRLARVALAKTYGQAVPYAGPFYDSYKIDGDKVRVTFKDANGGLVAKPLPPTYMISSLKNETAPLVRNSAHGEVEGFQICGEDHKWVWADAAIDGNAVVASNPAVAKPVAVRYAWANSPTANLYDKAGLPAAPFRTDTFPGATDNAKF